MIPFFGLATMVHLVIIAIRKIEVSIFGRNSRAQRWANSPNRILSPIIILSIGLFSIAMSYGLTRAAVTDENSNFRVLQRLEIPTHVYAFIQGTQIHGVSSQALVKLKTTGAVVTDYGARVVQGIVVAVR